MKNKKILYGAFMSILLASGVSAQTDSTAVDDFFDMEMSLEDLMGMEITSASKKAERLQDVSSSIYVINQNDIARSSATKLVEVLQQVPGFWIVDNSYLTTEANSRGATGGFVGTMLVLLDGVPIQNPFSSQMDYGTLDIPLNEIDRIEVIKGSGGTIYGANAATGVVNIFTKNAQDRNETYATVDYGNNNFINTSVGYSKNINEKQAFSIFGKVRTFDGHEPLDEFKGSNPTVPVGASDQVTQVGDSTISNQIGGDIWKSTTSTIGGRYQNAFSDKTKLTASALYNFVERDGFSVSINSYMPAFSDTSYMRSNNQHRVSGNVKLDHSFSDEHNLFVNASYNRQAGEAFINSGYKQSMDMIDLEVQDNIDWKFNSFSIGGNIRNVTFNVSDIVNENNVNYKDKTNNNKMLFGGFIQDKMSFFNNKLDVILGVKGEVWQLVSNDMYFSPSAKFAYKPNEKHTIWGSVSRAVSTPGFIHTNIALEAVNFGSTQDWIGATTLYLIGQGMTPQQAAAAAPSQYQAFFEGAMTAQGLPVDRSAIDKSVAITNANTTPSIFDWYEIGYRTSAIKKMTLEVNAFVNYQQNLINAGGINWSEDEWIANPASPSDTIIPLYYSNLRDGMSFGGEVIVKAMPFDFLTLEGSYSLLRYKTMDNDDSERIRKNFNDTTATPMHTIRMKAYVDLPKQFAVNITADWAGAFRGATEDDAFDYVNQRWTNVATGSPTDYISNPMNLNRIRLNFKATKKFADGKYVAYVWGNDMLEDGTLVRSRLFSQSVPTQLQRMYGLGFTANF